MALTTNDIALALDDVHKLFERHGIWHCVTYGTLLGATRGGDIIPWDYDFDLFVKPQDLDRLQDAFADAPAGLTVAPAILEGAALAVNVDRLASFWGSHLKCFKHGEPVGDLYAFTLFEDGVLRRFDLASDAYWCPHSSFPHFFVETRGEATIRGKRYPAPQHAETFLAGVYGDDWRTPYQAVMQGGAPREGTTNHGDLYVPKLAAEVRWCLEQGWDRSRYRGEEAWPRRIGGAGPVGPTQRTAHSSRALWWRSLDELQSLY